MLSWGYPQLCGGSGLLEASEDEIQVCLGLGTPNFRIPTYMGHLRSPSLEVSVARWRGQCPGTDWQRPVSGRPRVASGLLSLEPRGSGGSSRRREWYLTIGHIYCAPPSPVPGTLLSTFVYLQI